MGKSSVNFQATNGGLGAFVEGVDLSKNLSANLGKEIRQGLGEYGVLFFRNQDITPEQHLAFAERVGEVEINRFFQPVDHYPKIAEVRKEPEQQTAIGELWHTDHSYDFEPALGSILVARELPKHGGDTMFANMYSAYDALSDGMKKMLEGLQAEHSTRHTFGKVPTTGELADKEYAGRLGNQHLAVQDSIHPVVIKHPVSGRKALYVNGGFTTRFAGWATEESRPVLEYLYNHAARPEFTYRFEWQPGSIAFWDNRATWHRALNDYHGERRLMHRVTIQGESLTA